MEAWFADLRYALRVLRQRPGFVAVSIMTFAFGVGANAAIFSVVDGVLLEGLPFREPGRVVRLWGENSTRGWERSGVSWHDFLDIRASVKGLDAVAVFNVQSGNLSGADRPERVGYALAESQLFRVLGVDPVLGRTYHESEDQPGGSDVVVVGNAFWRRALGGRTDVVGKTLELDGQPLVIVGVMPLGFEFPSPQVALWKPFGMRPDDAGNRGARWVNGIGRLGPGVTTEQAQAELRGVTAALSDAYAETNRDWTVKVEPMLGAQVGSVRPLLYALWGAVALVLLIACGNTASLALARATARHREIAVRNALGAGRWRLTRQLMIEQSVVAIGGGVLGILVAVYAVRWLPLLAGEQLPRMSAIRVDAGVVAYGLAVAGLAGILSAVAPAWRVGAIGAPEALRGRSDAAGHRSVRRWHDGLVVTEIAMAIVVAVGAGVLARSFAQLMRIEPGFEIEGRLTFRVAQSWNAMPEREGAARFYRDLQDRLGEAPGVDDVGAVNRLPLSGNWWVSSLTIGGRGRPAVGEELIVNTRVVTPGYFEAMGIPLTRGRTVEWTDGADGVFVGVINEAAVQEFFGSEADPLGQRAAVEDPDHPEARWFTIVGVVDNVRHNTLTAQPTPIVYTPFAQSRFGHFGDWGMDVIVHAGPESANLAETVRSIVRDLDPTLPVYQIDTMRGVVGHDVADRQFALVVLGLFAAVAVFLAMVGVYGIMSYSVVQRRPELSVRAALGAGPHMLTGLVVRHGMRLMLVGGILGIGLSLGFTQWLTGLLFDVPASDPITMVGVLLLLGAATLLACLIPAARATRSNPSALLRNE